jgi:hypothetical protein
VTTSARNTSDAFNDDVDAPARLRHLPDDPDGADAVQIVGRRVIRLPSAEDEQHETVGAERPVDRFDRDRTIDRKWLQCQRESDSASKREDGSSGGSVGGVDSAISAIAAESELDARDDSPLSLNHLPGSIFVSDVDLFI